MHFCIKMGLISAQTIYIANFQFCYLKFILKWIIKKFGALPKNFGAPLHSPVLKVLQNSLQSRKRVALEQQIIDDEKASLEPLQF